MSAEAAEAPEAPMTGDPYAVPERRKPSEGTHLVNGVRAAVDAWRAQGYPGASRTTRAPARVLVRRRAPNRRRLPVPLLLLPARSGRDVHLPYRGRAGPRSAGPSGFRRARNGDRARRVAKRQRLAFKMATGSGKTMAMSLCIVWSYFHALYEPESPMATSFLVIAPNVIVFERLKSDFADAATFRRDPLLPPEWAEDFEVTVLLQNDPAPVTTRGVLYLTNVQRLYEPPARSSAKRTAPNPVEAMIGPRVKRDVEVSSAEELFDRIASRGRVMVVNDEAHHVWDEKLKWNQSIERLHGALARALESDTRVRASSRSSTSLRRRKIRAGSSSATSSSTTRWPQAVRDGIVKTPVIGEVAGAKVEPATPSVLRNRQWLDVAVGRWRKFHEALSPAGKRPVLFVMCENTQEADDRRRLPAPASRVRGRPAARDPHQPLGRDH